MPRAHPPTLAAAAQDHSCPAVGAQPGAQGLCPGWRREPPFWEFNQQQSWACIPETQKETGHWQNWSHRLTSSQRSQRLPSTALSHRTHIKQAQIAECPSSFLSARDGSPLAHTQYFPGTLPDMHLQIPWVPCTAPLPYLLHSLSTCWLVQLEAHCEHAAHTHSQARGLWPAVPLQPPLWRSHLTHIVISPHIVKLAPQATGTTTQAWFCSWYQPSLTLSQAPPVAGKLMFSTHAHRREWDTQRES